MAAGDNFQLLINSAGAWVNFQPAAGVEIILLDGRGENIAYVGVYDGALLGYAKCSDTTNDNTSSIKMTISNSKYFRGYSSTAAICASGIQTK